MLAFCGPPLGSETSLNPAEYLALCATLCCVNAADTSRLDDQALCHQLGLDPVGVTATALLWMDGIHDAYLAFGTVPGNDACSPCIAFQSIPSIAIKGIKVVDGALSIQDAFEVAIQTAVNACEGIENCVSSVPPLTFV